MGDRKVSQASDLFNWRSTSHNDTRIDLKEETYASSQEDIKRLQSDSIMKRIPKGAEATTVLVCTFPSIDFWFDAFFLLGWCSGFPRATHNCIRTLGYGFNDARHHRSTNSSALLIHFTGTKNDGYRLPRSGSIHFNVSLQFDPCSQL